MGFYGISPGQMEFLTEQVVAELRHRLDGVQDMKQGEGYPSGAEMWNKSQSGEVCRPGVGMQIGMQSGEMCRPGVGMQIRKKTGKQLLVIGSLKAEEERLLGMDYNLSFDIINGEWDMLLITRLSPETMAYGAHGISGNPEAASLLRGLLEGKRVFLLQRGLIYRGYRESASKNLYSLYLQQEDTLRNLGVQVIEQVPDLEQFLRMSPGIPQRIQDGLAGSGESFLDFTHLRLLKEADLFRARAAGAKTIRLGRETRITPLAMDFISNHSLSVLRE